MGMRIHPTGSVADELKELIERAIDGSEAQVAGGGGHYEITVRADAFAGQSLLAKQRLVYSAIAPMMKGEHAPVHAIDRLTTVTP